MHKSNSEFSDLVEILVALVCQGDGYAKDGVSTVLIKTCLAVTSKQSQCPASTNTSVSSEHKKYIQVTINALIMCDDSTKPTSS